jgi:hypothetical protein
MTITNTHKEEFETELKHLLEERAIQFLLQIHADRNSTNETNLNCIHKFLQKLLYFSSSAEIGIISFSKNTWSVCFSVKNPILKQQVTITLIELVSNHIKTLNTFINDPNIEKGRWLERDFTISVKKKAHVYFTLVQLPSSSYESKYKYFLTVIEPRLIPTDPSGASEIYTHAGTSSLMISLVNTWFSWANYQTNWWQVYCKKLRNQTNLQLDISTLDLNITDSIILPASFNDLREAIRTGITTLCEDPYLMCSWVDSFICKICTKRNQPYCEYLDEDGNCNLTFEKNTLSYWIRWWDINAKLVRSLRNMGNPFWIDANCINKDNHPNNKEFHEQLSKLRKQAITDILPNENLLPKALHKFFLNRALNPDVNTIFKNLNSFTFSDEETAIILSNIAKTAYYFLTDMPINQDILQSLIWLISEYTHQVLGVPHRIDFRAHLLQASRGEPALHVLKDYYRDHFFHAIEVCFLGHFLLELKVLNSVPLWEIVAEKLKCPKDDQKVLHLWYLASLLHDIGYGIDVLKGARSLLKFFKNDELLNEFVTDLTNISKVFSAKLGERNFCNYTIEDNPGEDHGVIAARHLYGLLKKITTDDPSISISDYKPVISAIAKHNSRKHTVKFEDEPLAFLLILCDTIQEWNRPKLCFSTAPAQLLSLLMEHGISEEQLTGPLNVVRINAKPNKNKDYFELDLPNSLCFELEYTEDIHKNAGVFNLWLDATYNLQRLDFTGLDLNIDIKYITPIYKNTNNKEMQFHRLRDAMHETHMGFLADWFPTNVITENEITKITNEAVTYIPPRNENGNEQLILHLRKLSKEKLITKDIETFREHLRHWQRYNEDRDFIGDYGMPEYPG